MTTRQQIGQAIRMARAAKGWTQDELADHVGVSRPAISQWEQGKNWPQAGPAHKLRTLLGIDFPDYEEVGPITQPPRLSASDVRGVRYAALEMSKVVTRLLQEAVDAEDFAEAEARRQRAIEATQRAKSARPAGSETPPRRRAKG